jgi:hypothetical protein
MDRICTLYSITIVMGWLHPHTLLISNRGKPSACHTVKGKSKRAEREVIIMTVLAEGSKGGLGEVFFAYSRSKMSGFPAIYK